MTDGEERRKAHDRLEELERKIEAGELPNPTPIPAGWHPPGYTIMKDWCPECGGLGHGKKCKCSDGVAFVMGCCKTCGGEGMITLPPDPPKGIVITDPDWKL